MERIQCIDIVENEQIQAQGRQESENLCVKYKYKYF